MDHVIFQVRRLALPIGFYSPSSSVSPFYPLPSHFPHPSPPLDGLISPRGGVASPLFLQQQQHCSRRKFILPSSNRSLEERPIMMSDCESGIKTHQQFNVNKAIVILIEEMHPTSQKCSLWKRNIPKHFTKLRFPPSGQLVNYRIRHPTSWSSSLLRSLQISGHIQ